MIKCKKCDKAWDNLYGSKEFKSCCPYCGELHIDVKDTEYRGLIIQHGIREHLRSRIDEIAINPTLWLTLREESRALHYQLHKLDEWRARIGGTFITIHGQEFRYVQSKS